MVCLSLLQWTTLCQTSPPWPILLGWPHLAWLSFLELDKTVVDVIRLASFLWLWLQCVCPLMPSYNTYHLTWVSLTLDVGYLLPWMWGISSWLLQQSAATAPYLGLGRLSWPWTWSSSSWPSCIHAATTPWTWGCSSQPLPLSLGGFRKGRGTRDQIANILWIIKKQESSRKNISFCFIDYAKAFVRIRINCGKFWKRWEYQTTWPASWETYMQVRKQQLELDIEQQTGSK